MWGAPDDQPDHAARSVAAAIEMLEHLGPLREALSETTVADFGFGIGLNTGRAQVGNIGSDVRFLYGPLGNSVNLASRVQGMTKQFGVRAMISFGRDSNNDHRIDRPGVSGCHGRLIVGPHGTLVVEDLGSTNGIEVQIVDELNDQVDVAQQRQAIVRSALVDAQSTIWLCGVPVRIADLLAQRSVAAEPAGGVPNQTAGPTLGRETLLRWGMPLAVCLIVVLVGFAAVRVVGSGAGGTPVAATAPNEVTPPPEPAGNLAPIEPTQPPAVPPRQLTPPKVRPPEIRPPEIRPPEIRPPEIRPPEIRPPEIRPPEIRPPVAETPPPVAPPTEATDPIAKARRAIVWITVSKPDEPHRFLAGSGWVAASDTVLTTGSIMLEVKKLRDEGHSQLAVHWIAGRSDHQIGHVDLHPNVESAYRDAATAYGAYSAAFSDQNLPEDSGQVDSFLKKRGEQLLRLGVSQAAAIERLVAHDVARLIIDPPVDAGAALPMRDPGDIPRPRQRLRMVGYPIDEADPLLDPANFIEPLILDWRVERVVRPPDRAAAMLLRSTAPAPAGRIEGSPLIDGAGRVAGVYSCPVSAATPDQRNGERRLGSPLPAAFDDLPPASR